jgi:hypothetical protein
MLMGERGANDARTLRTESVLLFIRRQAIDWRSRAWRAMVTQAQDALREQVRGILAQLDPAGAVVAGGDYHAEAERILGALEPARSAEDVAFLVLSIFVEMFGAAKVGPLADYAEIGKEIWQAYRPQ